MAIYSANRMGQMATATVVAKEGYGTTDIGRIMYESELNDRAIFEAVIKCDFNEINALREGTLLESEVKAANKKSAKEFFAHMKARLQDFWAKIKNVFKIAIQKIGAYIFRDGAAFVKDFERDYEKLKEKNGAYAGEINGIKLLDYSEIKKADASRIERGIRDIKDNLDGMTKADIINGGLGELCGETVESTKEFKEKYIEKVFSDRPITVRDIDRMKGNLINANKVIKGLKEAEDRANKILNRVEDELKKAEKKAENGDKSVVGNISTLVGAFETVIATLTNTQIHCVRLDVKNSRRALSKILRDMSGVTNESAEDIVGDSVESDGVDAALDDTVPTTELDADTQAAINDAVEEAESEIETENN